jgi:hypothetical protein
MIDFKSLYNGLYGYIAVCVCVVCNGYSIVFVFVKQVNIDALV